MNSGAKLLAAHAKCIYAWTLLSHERVLPQENQSSWTRKRVDTSLFRRFVLYVATELHLSFRYRQSLALTFQCTKIIHMTNKKRCHILHVLGCCYFSLYFRL